MQHVWSRDLYEVTADAAGLHLFVPTVDEVMAGMKPKHRERFEAAVSKLEGTGMVLVPVVYTRISKSENQAVLDEFMETAEPAFYKRLARDHESELREAGFCDHAIAQMHKGHAPTDSEGRIYNYDVDHVIERAGGGLLSTVRRIDPALIQDDPDNPQETFDVNHMSNFYFLPRELHEIKNEINGLQSAGNTPMGESKIIYMAVPAGGNDTPFYRPAAGYGPAIMEGEIPQQSYAALSEASQARSLVERFYDAEGAIFREFCRMLKGGAVSAESRATVCGNVEEIMSSDAKLRFRYNQICDTLRNVDERLGKIAEGIPHATTSDRNSAMENYKSLVAKLAPITDFVLDDGTTVGERLAQRAAALSHALSAPQEEAALDQRQPATLIPKTS